jgi:hypothetical protein
MPSTPSLNVRYTLLALGLSSATLSQAMEPAAIDAGIFKVTPFATLDTKYDDNIFSQQSGGKSSLISVLNPSVEAIADNGQQKYTLGYGFIAGVFHDSADDNYLDHSLYAQGEWAFGRRHQLAADLSFFLTHEDRGTGFSQGAATFATDSPDTYLDSALAATYTFGGIKTKGRLVTDLEYYDKSYTNHKSTTRGRERVNITLGETFYWNITGATDALFELVYTDVNYKSDPTAVAGAGDTLDNRVIKAYAGATWQVTGKTEGSVKVGYADKAFDDTDRDDFNGLSWETSVTWLPKSYSSLTFTLGRRQDESSGSGDYIDGKDIGVIWSHDWKERFNTELVTNYSDEDYAGDPNGQEDQIFNTELRANYDMRRWLTVGASYRFETRDSNQAGQDYDRNIFAVHFEASL